MCILQQELRMDAVPVNRFRDKWSRMFFLECETPRAHALVSRAVCVDTFFIQGCKLASANYCYAHTVDYIHGLRLGWAGGANVWEAAQIRNGGRPNSSLRIQLGELRSAKLPPEFCCFVFIMAAVQTEPSHFSQSWQRPFSIYGGLTCNALMAGRFFLCL